MSTYAALNRAENISVADASALLGKLAALGLYFGPIHVNESSGGPANANIIPLDEVDEKLDLMCLVAYAAGNWHNLAILKLTFGSGGMDGFKRVYNDLYVSADANQAIINIPGMGAAMDKFIKKATA
jgi:hypothetical protein